MNYLCCHPDLYYLLELALSQICNPVGWHYALQRSYGCQRLSNMQELHIFHLLLDVVNAQTLTE